MLKNKTIIIVGGSSGIGLATAKHLYSKGANLIIVARNEDRLRKAADSIGLGIGRIQLIPADLTSEQGRAKIVESAERVDHVVVTAADLAYMPFEEFTYEAALRIVNSKLLGPFFLVQMIKSKLSKDGSITLTSGIAAERPMPGGVLTGAINAALQSLVKGLALVLAPIRVNAISPGWTETPIWESVIPDPVKKMETIRSMSQKIPLGRIGRPENMALGIEGLIANDFINATVLDVNGGQLLV